MNKGPHSELSQQTKVEPVSVFVSEPERLESAEVDVNIQPFLQQVRVRALCRPNREPLDVL